MITVFSTLLLVILAIAAIWIAVFGTAGASIAAKQHDERLKGFVIGALLGPAGILWLSIRRSRMGVHPTAVPTSPFPTTAQQSQQSSTLLSNDVFDL